MTAIGRDINQAANLLRKDELVAIPTETVYGLAGNALSEKAIHKIFVTKQRPFTHPIILHIKSIAEIFHFCCDVPQYAIDILEAFGPGPITMILKKKTSLVIWPLLIRRK